MIEVACLAARTGAAERDNDIDLEPNEFGRDLGESLAASVRPTILDRDGAAFDPAKFAQPLYKSGDPWARAEACSGQYPMVGIPAAARAPRAAKPRRAAEQHDELAPPHVLPWEEGSHRHSVRSESRWSRLRSCKCSLADVRIWVCAVTRRRFPVGASPTRRPLQPEATGAVMEVTKWLKPSDSVSRYTVTARVCRP